MPLSDEEERVLAELEAQLASDRVSSRVTDVSSQRRGTAFVPLLGGVALLLAVVGFIAHVALGVVGFIGLVAAVTYFAKASFGYFIDDSEEDRYY